MAQAQTKPSRPKKKKQAANLPPKTTEPEPVQLVEQHLIRAEDPRFAPIDQAAFAAKNLYNKANYLVRQAFIFEQRYIGYTGTFHLLKKSEEYCALPRKVSNQVLIQLDHDWQAFFAAMKV
jgi:putative transposase